MVCRIIRLMSKYKVIIKEVYTYEDVPAKSKQEAIDKVLTMDWPAHDDQDKPLEIKAIQQPAQK